MTSGIGAALGKLAGSAAVRSLVYPFRRGRASVFMLHRIGGIHPGIDGHDPAAIARVLDELKRQSFRFATVAELGQALVERRELQGDVVAFTVDDGYADQVEVLAPIFLDRAIPLTLFAITGLIDGQLWPWDSKIHWLVRQSTRDTIKVKLGNVTFDITVGSASARREATRRLQSMFAGLPSEKLSIALAALEEAVAIRCPELPPPEFAPATWAQLRQLEPDGLGVAPHTVTHRIISRLSAAESRREIADSWARVKAEMAEGLPTFAWPVGKPGQFGPREFGFARKVGLTMAFSAIEGYSAIMGAADLPECCYSLNRFAWADSPNLMLRYSSGLEAARERLPVRTRVVPDPEAATSHGWTRLARTSKRRLSAWSEQLAQVLSPKPEGRDTDLSSIKRLVFVCKGNVCRSPFAEALARVLGAPAVSCGLEVDDNDPAEPLAVQVGLSYGADLTDHVSKSIHELSLARGDCLVAMEPGQLPPLRNMAATKGCVVTLLGMWHPPPVLRIPDPYGSSIRAFHSCFATIDKSVRALVSALNRGSGKPETHTWP